MVEVRELENGRFEVFAEGLHQEAFEGRLGAQLASQAIGMQLANELGVSVAIHTPWGPSYVPSKSATQPEVRSKPDQSAASPDLVKA
ncbi:hypothetical protein [Luteimonas sp. 100069]|uniref:hypothetical protein n=1 Tax=Luteimonas sp. 100069 TaxID=2006109 RepID=UPI000F507944|nr:hypothetical protein [Luteimonas sp. 100069]